MALTTYRMISSLRAPIVHHYIYHYSISPLSGGLLLPSTTPWTYYQAARNGICFSTKSSSSKEPLHQVLQRHLLKDDTTQMTTSQRAILKFSTDGKQTTEPPSTQRSSKHHYTSVQERSRMQQQAVINGLIAFSVVILACQNLKASVEKRQIQEQLRQQEEECQTTRQALKQLLQRSHIDEVARQIARELEAPNDRISNGRWFRTGNVGDSTSDGSTAQLIADRLEQQLRNIVGDAALDDMERDLKKVQSLTTPSESEHISTITKEVDMMSDPALMDDVLAALQSDNNNETGPKVVKKRLFSM